MRDRLRVFVCEFITGGGLAGEPLPQGLAAEGEQMLAALLRDLDELDGIEVVTTRDSRLAPLPGVTVHWLAPGDDPWRLWRALIRETGATWPIAPETGCILERLSRLVLEQQRALLGSRPEAVQIAASKLRAAGHLARLGVPVVPTAAETCSPPFAAQGWVVKPDDGAGCEETYFAVGPEALHSCLARSAGTARVVQPWLDGAAASVSMLCLDGEARVLACNAQDVVCRDGVLHMQGVRVHALAALRPRLEPVAAAVARALPGLWGYVGVDVIAGEDDVWVVDVNPRLTSAYPDVRAVLGCNTAALVLEMLRSGTLPKAPCSPDTVAVCLES